MHEKVIGAAAAGIAAFVVWQYKSINSPPIKASIACNCGKVQGQVDTPAGMHIVCYCDDCQDFANKVCQGKNSPLDSCGGTDIIQMFPADITFTKGKDQLQIGKLKPETKTLRIFASCCNTPMYNTAKDAAFIGLLTSTIRDQVKLPPVQFRIMSKFALAPVPGASNIVSFGLVLNFFTRCFLYKRRTYPSPVDLTQQTVEL
ncbi:hypothetical protein THRCLA_02136 [Thraustotheca clavata]|uniref:CENP-V/GFA domain-containing protein n=1 Tax=Thraustotheca clavata TaxID=74557 RepID=A0A1W0A6F7_9STRA|nr:hypothetical protein THRCLA_02136 [Thraustotheca clavata]